MFWSIILCKFKSSAVLKQNFVHAQYLCYFEAVLQYLWSSVRFLQLCPHCVQTLRVLSSCLAKVLPSEINYAQCSVLLQNLTCSAKDDLFCNYSAPFVNFCRTKTILALSSSNGCAVLCNSDMYSFAVMVSFDTVFQFQHSLAFCNLITVLHFGAIPTDCFSFRAQSCKILISSVIYLCCSITV